MCKTETNKFTFIEEYLRFSKGLQPTHTSWHTFWGPEINQTIAQHGYTFVVLITAEVEAGGWRAHGQSGPLFFFGWFGLDLVPFRQKFPFGRIFKIFLTSLFYLLNVTS